jgi:DNA-directed RNA polymerase specialized sigma24 family protein
MSTVLNVEEGIRALRKALRSGRGDAIDQAAAPYIAALRSPLAAYADRLVRSAWRSLGLEGDDLVQEAWIRALTYLTEPAGESIQTGEHLRRLLLRMIKQRFLDILDREEGRDEQGYDEAKAEEITGTVDLAEGLLWLEGGARQELIGALFAGEEAFRRVCPQKPKRRARHYQGYVLYTLARFYQSEVLSTSEAAALFERYIVLLGVSPDDWKVLESIASQPEAGEAELLQAVNGLCGTNLTDRGTLSVLRYELGLLAG